MRRTTLLLLVLTVAVGMFAGMGIGHAAHCGTGASNAHDPFGSCENVVGNGHVECGPGTVIPGVAVISMPTNAADAGVEGCAEDASQLPIAGRVGIYRAANGDIAIFADGDDTTNTGGAAAWDRVDIRPGAASCKVQVRRGTGGTWWTSGGGTSPADSVNQCAA